MAMDMGMLLKLMAAKKEFEKNHPSSFHLLKQLLTGSRSGYCCGSTVYEAYR